MSKVPIHPEITFIGETNFRNQDQQFGIKVDDRRRHMYLIGKTGMGKSTVLENLVIQDIYNGRGLALVDPHGDLVEKVLKFIPKHRINDVIYFNPSDIDYPISFNVLEKVDPQYRHLVASGLVGVFKKIWAESWGPRLEYLLRNAILALLDYPESTLLGITRMMIDPDFRKKIIAKVEDPVVKSFWVDEFSKYNQQFMTEAISPIQNKVGQFLSSSLIRNVVGQVKSSINIRKMMDEEKILLLNLSKGRIGEDNSALLGAMMITKIQLAAMSRVDIEEDTRRDFYLYVDEFQNFATESFANILSEARKYRLCLVMAHQYVEQLGDVVKAAVFGNVGSMIVFRIGASDAAELVKEFEPTFTEEDLVNLPKYNFYTKLMIDGISSNPFSAAGMPPFSGNTGATEKVITVSRERYSSPRIEVEDKIRRWSGMATPEEEAVKLEEKKRVKRNKKKMKKLQKLLPEYEEKAKAGDEEAKEVFAKLPDAIEKLSQNIDVDLGDIIGRKEDFEEEIAKEVDQEIEKEEQEEAKKAAPAPRGERRQMHEYKCDECNKVEKLPFELDPNKPIYCKSCLKERKERRANRVANKDGGGGRDGKKRSRGKRGGKNNKERGSEVKADIPKEISLNQAKDKTVSLKNTKPKE